MSDYPTSLEACYALIDQLREALQTRDVIGQAKGILMAREGFSDADAFAVLVRASQHRNQKLRDVAAEIVLRNQPAGGSRRTSSQQRSDAVVRDGSRSESPRR